MRGIIRSHPTRTRAGRRRLPGGSSLLFPAALAALVATGCADRAAPDLQRGIVAEADARGARGLAQIHAARMGDDPALRALAVRALGRLEDPAQLDLLIDALNDDPDARVRVVAATAVAQSVSRADPMAVQARPTARAALIARMNPEDDGAVLGALAANLGRLAPAEDPDPIAAALAALATRLPSANPPARLGFARALESFARLAPPLPPTLADAATDLLVFGLEEDGAATGYALDAARIRRLAVAALAPGAQIDSARLGDLLTDPDWGVRRQAVVAAGRSEGTGADRALRAGLGDRAFEVRLEALAAYARSFAAGRACTPLLQAISDPNPHVADRATELAAELCPHNDALRPLLLRRIARLDDGGDWTGAGVALQALAGIAPEEAEAGLRSLARHPEPFARMQAARGAAVARLTDVIVDLAADPVPNVREASLRALAGALTDGAAAERTRARDIHLGQLAENDPQLVMTAVRQLAVVPDSAMGPAIVAALARFTARQRQTERDVRMALLEGLGVTGGFAHDDLAPYLTDFDPVVAARAAEILGAITGEIHSIAPTPLPLAPPPDPARLQTLAQTTVVLHMRQPGAVTMSNEDEAAAPGPAPANPDPAAIVIRLRPDLAATNADRFARMVAAGAFDGRTFHRVEPNFVVQGGSPNANEYSGEGPFSRDEISDHPHWRGTVGLSTRGRDTGDGQIFINLADNVRLDFNYTIFGEVVTGMEVVDGLRAGAVIERAEVVHPAPPDSAAALARRVEIRRNGYGVPHILAEDLAAMGFGLGFVQSEDYSASIATGMMASRGRLARHLGRSELEADFRNREIHAVATGNFHNLGPETRAVYRGFAAGVNHYIRTNPDEFPPWIRPDFTGIDALARDVQTWSRQDASEFLTTLVPAPPANGRRAAQGDSDNDPGRARVAEGGGSVTARAGWLLDGSNAWAFHGERTESGHAILLRNPHLRWEGDHNLLERPSGLTYYEAQVRVPGVLEFHGDFRIGTAFGIIGGFNANLGWATTNNSPELSRIYALETDPALPGHARLDGQPLPMTRRDLRVEYRRADGILAVEMRPQWRTTHGPVIGQANAQIFVLKDPRDGVFQRGEQFLRMMTSADLDEWLDVMKMRAHPTSNFTYADRGGNIVHYYNARLPQTPHRATPQAIRVRRADEIWSELVPWGDLPLYLNPPGGYVQQANDPPDFTNLNVPLDRDTVAAHLPPMRLRLRSQLSLDLAAGSGRLTPERVIELKHSPRMLMAERVMNDLVEAARGDPALDAAVQVLEAWDRTAAAESRGAILFARWAALYFGESAHAALWREEWDPARPVETPAGLGDAVAARRMLAGAVAAMEEEGLALDLAWGDLHRVVRGDVDAPVSGCPATLGCFRTLSFATMDDGRRAANRGDAWVLVVEFGEVPRAWTVLAYGQTARQDAPHHADQAALFARGEMKSVAWREEDVLRETVRRYRP